MNEGLRIAFLGIVVVISCVVMPSIIIWLVSRNKQKIDIQNNYDQGKYLFIKILTKLLGSFIILLLGILVLISLPVGKGWEMLFWYSFGIFFAMFIPIYLILFLIIKISKNLDFKDIMIFRILIGLLVLSVFLIL